MDDKKTKYLIAAKGFSANGVTMTEGEYVSNQFDEQTVKVLKGMGRLVDTETAPADEPKKKLTAAEKKALADSMTVGDVPAASTLPGLPGT